MVCVMTGVCHNYSYSHGKEIATISSIRSLYLQTVGVY